MDIEGKMLMDKRVQSQGKKNKGMLSFGVQWTLGDKNNTKISTKEKLLAQVRGRTQMDLEDNGISYGDAILGLLGLLKDMERMLLLLKIIS